MEEKSPFTHILVPIDGSEPSVYAGQYAIRIAALHEIPITFVYVIDDTTTKRIASATSRSVEDVYRELRNKARSYLTYLARLAQNRGLQADQETRQGVPHREIAHLARQCGADLIVMGQAGVGGPHRLDIGSVSKRVIECAPCPVLVAKPPLPRG